MSKKIITALLCSVMASSALAQWTPTTFERKSTEKHSVIKNYYKLDLNRIRTQLNDAQETGRNAKPVEISLPTLDGKIERFAVYSFPVMVKELADKYQLGSYVGVGIDDPFMYVRFSVAPNDFQSMIIKDGKYEFIEPQNTDKTVYGVHPKSNKSNESFVCSTNESQLSKQEIANLYEKGKSFSNQPTDFSKNSDKKYRTMRLAMSLTGEYTQFFGGTVAGALTAINATMTRVNGVFEKDFALHLNVQDYPGIIYTDAATDPYSPSTQLGNWNLELQNTLTTNVGNANYDIGHLFGASGGGGNAGCIGCVCTDPTTAAPQGKGSGITSPGSGGPQGDNFDIDYVAHEMGHQLGDNHTFSFQLEGSGVNQEPGTGSTIMGYAGIRGPLNDVQAHSDPYFHIASIKQFQANLISKTCDVETTITNNPPVIAALPTYNIPKGTAFVLTASATDAENDPMTYTWEEVDDASAIVNRDNLGTTSSGASFRSLLPTTNPTRYFPKLSSVLSGVLDNSNNGWESVSMVPRTTKFAVTVRDNSPSANQQQTQYAEQTIVVGNDGPFKINTSQVYHNVSAAILWDVANTAAAPYVLAANVGQANYDIGHLFGASGGGGNAGCVGCVCLSPVGTTYDPVAGYGKGSGITSPLTGSVNPSASAPPSGDTFDIDFVAHEMGHQLGANHSFSHTMQGSPVQMEPGSGSTIMGYAGITGATTDVQPHSDAYFHAGNIAQVQTNLISKTCDVETAITNNPPVIAALPSYNIPKGTAFVLTASATDAENDPMTYTWEEMDNASVIVDKNNLGTTTSGATFRSLTPTTSPTRYFPMFSSVMNGVLNNSGNTWESVSMVPRTTKFGVTVRDNSPIANQQQTQYAEQTIVVGNDGPFKINTQYANVNVATPIDWDVANTAVTPYNVANVKIDYTTNNGTTWTVLSASTANDGTESFTFPASLNGQIIKVRISSIGNVFYAVKSVTVTAFAPCDGSAPTGVAASNISSNGATVSWTPVINATYVIRYRKVGQTTWQQTTSTSPTITLSGLTDGTAYEVQVAAVCSGTPGTFSASTNFTTLSIPYCTASSTTSASLYISKVMVANINNISAGNPYTDFTNNSALQVNLVKGVSNSMTITSNVAAYDFAMIFIDYNRDGVFDSSERVLNFPVAGVASFTGSFTVPTTALEVLPLRMRVVLGNTAASNVGLSAPDTWVCGVNYTHGEIEDYNVVVASTLGTRDVASLKDDIQIYPNPVSDVLNITNISDKATFKIYSAAGQLVQSGNINNKQVNVSSLIKGAYVIKIEDKNISKNNKFIKK